jgi:hypothetical protein
MIPSKGDLLTTSGTLPFLENVETKFDETETKVNSLLKLTSRRVLAISSTCLHLRWHQQQRHSTTLDNQCRASNRGFMSPFFTCWKKRGAVRYMRALFMPAAGLMFAGRTFLGPRCLRWTAERHKLCNSVLKPLSYRYAHMLIGYIFIEVLHGRDLMLLAVVGESASSLLSLIQQLKKVFRSR